MAKTILLADDSVTIRKIVELTFGGSEIRVLSVANGADAMQRLSHDTPDLVLADVVMPEPSGYEICRVVKSSERPVPVVLLTGAFEPYDPERARECGADDHLVKPFESSVLMDKVRQLLEPPPPEAEIETVEEVDSMAEEVQQAGPGPDSSVAATEAEETQGAIDIAIETAEPHRMRLTPVEIDAIAREVVRRLSEDVIREVVREIVPDLARTIIRDRIRELEGEE